MMMLSLCLALQDRRVTLELRYVSLAHAARQALEPFGQPIDWIPPEAAARRINLSLKDAGFFQALDAVSGLAELPRLDSPFHRATRPGLICGNVFDGCRTIDVLDLSSAARLIVVRRELKPDDVTLDLTLVLPPGPARPLAKIRELSLNGLPLLPPTDFLLWNDGKGRPMQMRMSCPAPLQKPGESFQVSGELVLEWRRLSFATDAVLLLPDPRQAPSGKPSFLNRYWKPLCLAGMALAIGLIVRCIRRLRPADVTN